MAEQGDEQGQGRSDESIDKSQVSRLSLIKDVLDNQLVDVNERKMGRVDGIILELREGQPPRLACIDTGLEVLAVRVHPRFGQWVSTLIHRVAKDHMPYRIPWDKVTGIGIDVKVDLDAEKTPAFALENWLRDHVIGRIPGAGSPEEDPAESRDGQSNR